MADFFKGQMDYIFFFYGLAFILLAAICLSFQRRLRPKLAWMWLAAFGAAHGVNEWLDLAALTLGSGPVFDIVRLGVMALSFVFLAEFGRASVVAIGGRSPGRWILAALLGLAALGGFSGLPGLSASARYALGLVGGLWAAGALYLASRVPAPGSRALQGAALGMAGYAIAAGLVVNPAPFFPASLLNADFFITAVGLPIQLVRGLLAVWISGSLWLMAGAFLVRGDYRRILVWGRNLMMGGVAGVIILLGCGWLLTQRLGNEAFQAERFIQEHKGEVLEGMMLEKMAGADHLVAVMSGSLWVVPALATGQPGRVQEANKVLDRYCNSFPQSVCYLLDLQGVTIASSNRHRPDSFVGKSYAFRPYFQQASQGSPGRYWALGVTSREVGYYASAPVRNGGGKIVGVAVIKIPLTGMGGFFTKQALSFVIDSHGIVVLTNRPDLVLQSLWPLSGAAREEVLASRQFGDGPFMPILTQEPEDGGEGRFQGERLLVLRRPFSEQGLSVVILNSMRPILMARLTGIGATLFFCLVLIGLLTIIGMTIDATAHIQLTERKYRELYGRLRDGSVAVNLEGTIVEFNPAFQQMLGYSPEEMRRLTYRDITPEKWHPVEAGIIEGQVLERGYSDLYEKEYRRQDGAVIPVELQTYLVRDEAGRPAGMWAFVRDITHRKQIEANVLNEKILADTTIDSLPGVFYLFDQQGRFLRWNENLEKASGYSAEEFAGMHPLELFGGEDQKKVEERIQEVFEKGESSVEADLLSKDGRKTPYIFTGMRITLDGTPCLIGTGIDISKRRRAEEALRESEEKYRLLINQIPSVVFNGFGDWSVDFFDNKIEALTGFPKEDFNSRKITWCDLILPEDLNNARRIFIEALKTDKSYVREYRIRKKDGGISWIQAMGNIICDAAGKVDHISGVFFDITERKQAEENLRQTRDYLDNLINHANAPIIVWDPSFRITQFNRAFENLTGYSAQEVVGRKLDLLFPEASCEDSLSKIASTSGGEYWESVEIPILRKDGDIRLASWNSANIHAEDGATLVATIAQGQDITERKRAEETLRESEQKYRLLVTNVPAMVYKGYADWSVDFFDDKIEELTGHPWEDFNARRLKWSELILTEDREGAKEAVIQALKTDKSFVREYRIWGKSGTVHWIRERGRIICGPEGKIDYISGTFVDITKQKAMDEALKQERDFISALLETVGALVVVLDPEGRIVSFNHACELATGYTFDLVKGKHYWDLFLPAAGIEPAKAYFQQLRAGNFPFSHESYWVNIDGSHRLINWTNTCLVGEDGAVRHIIGTGIDITRRRQAEAALEHLRLQNRMILNSAGEGIFGVDLEGRATFVNPAALEKFGYQAEELLGRSIHELVHSSKANGSIYAKKECPLQGTLQDGKVRRITDDVFWNKEGKPFPVEYVTTPLMEKGELVGAATVFRDVAERKQWEGELQAANERLKLLVGESQERNRNISLINEMNEVFQTCQVSMEAYQAIGHFAPRLFPGEDGALYVLNDSRNLLEAVTVWGESPPPESMFAPEECWAIRRGRLYALEDAGSGLPCPHISGALAGGYLCVPLAAQGETLGILHVRLHPAGREHDPGDPLSPLMEAKQRLALTVSENMALALANLKLRETLRGQAIRDPLTGLFNRRYLEETLNRELHRIQRLGASLGAVMMDLDHFKEYNDTYGHDGGDAMLRAVGALIKTHCRAEDIQCRYGGEEFLLILPGASLEVTLERAEKLREAVKELQIHHRDRYINPTTMSLGVAVFPDHGATGEDLIRAADNALYRAKAQGRDRVVAASARGAEIG